MLPESELDLDEESVGLLAPVHTNPAEVDTSPLLARIIHAKKMQRNDLDANCRLLKAYYRAQGKNCEVDRVNQTCQAKRAEINSLIGFYHKMRGDRRKLFTRVWHNVKRNSSNFWYKIGPVGRNFLRQMGKEALQMVVSGGFSGSVFKTMVEHTAKTMGREQIRKIAYQGVARLLKGQLALAEAAGVDICADEEQEEVTTEEKKEEQGDCAANNTWVDSYWEEVVLPRLVEEKRNCQIRAGLIYKDCLEEQAYSGVCLDDAVKTCAAQYQSIPQNDSGGSVSISPAIMHGGAESVATSLTYPSAGGAVTGDFFFIIEDNVNYCTVTISSTITSGNYDLETCSINGTAQLVMVHDGIACPDVCGPSTGACPKTLQGNVPLDITLEDGEISGGVGIKACDPGCFGIWTGP